ncbi:hypothetical protein JKP88DRAFT_350005 [Tribonema minus]|uniref:Uncharacterized protein n=1 Tax=Tribonema minus TaxID=303371 RepID=A0A836CAN2_9STRA|nr:hypothetical protein JKP88DRAFT_350005 [Tribonema minus]
MEVAPQKRWQPPPPQTVPMAVEPAASALKTPGVQLGGREAAGIDVLLRPPYAQLELRHHRKRHARTAGSGASAALHDPLLQPSRAAQQEPGTEPNLQEAAAQGQWGSRGGAYAGSVEDSSSAVRSLFAAELEESRGTLVSAGANAAGDADYCALQQMLRGPRKCRSGGGGRDAHVTASSLLQETELSFSSYLTSDEPAYTRMYGSPPPPPTQLPVSSLWRARLNRSRTV